MDLTLKIVLLAFVLIYIVTILYFVRKNKLNIKYSLIWILSGAILFGAVLIPGLLETFSKLLGFKSVINFLFFSGIFILLFLSLSLTIIVSTQNRKIRILIQEISILKAKDKKKSKR